MHVLTEYHRGHDIVVFKNDRKNNEIREKREREREGEMKRKFI